MKVNAIKITAQQRLIDQHKIFRLYCSNKMTLEIYCATNLW